MGFRVLVIDDDPAHGTMIKRALGTSGLNAEIVLVGGIAAALSALASPGCFDLMLVDLNLNNESGLDLVQALRADPQRQDLLIVVISTSETENDVQRSYRAGADCYIVKASDPVLFGHNIAAAAAYFLRRAPAG
jgi:CheY-like chemotaxis protein